MKYLGINVTKFVHHLYEENYTTSMNKNKEELNKWRYSACLWTGRLSRLIVKISVLKIIYRFRAIVKSSARVFCRYKLILAFICGDKRPRTANTIEGEQSWRTDTI